MKVLLITLTFGLALNATAKLSDFNSIIEENSKAQNELHANLTANLNDTKLAVKNEARDRFLVDSAGAVNVPTKKGFLTFAKEKSYHRASELEAKKRLAQEVDSAE
ncbi:MAG: hypothetical protein WA160_03515 [Pseudobdellovibrio sp.]